jgi:L-fuculose-phosphate aldolase
MIPAPEAMRRWALPRSFLPVKLAAGTGTGAGEWAGVANEREIRQAIVEVYVELGRQRLNFATSGNVSVRYGRGMLITPSGCTEATLNAAQIVETALDGGFAGDISPSSEWAIHAEVYRRVADAHAVVHTHADACVALAALHRPLPAFHYMIYGFGGADVPCVPYHPFGTRALGEAAGAALETRTACLLANHGMLSRGRTLAQALDAAVRLETLARQYLLALTVGEPVLLDEAQMRAVAERYADYGRQPKAKVTPRWSVP